MELGIKYQAETEAESQLVLTATRSLKRQCTLSTLKEMFEISILQLKSSLLNMYVQIMMLYLS